MTTTENDIIRDDQERSSLLRAIAGVEIAIASATPSTRRVLENTLENAKKRVAVLDKTIEQAKAEHAAEVQAQATMAAALAAKESKLSAEEKEAYRGFLEKAYFTKKDFGKLDQFYAHSYDRLSESGKDEMSKRIHEGIRRGEFRFTDLPPRVQEKDREHCAAKDRKEAPTQTSNNRSATSNTSTKSVEAARPQNFDLGSVDLSGIKLTEAAAAPSASSLPDASGTKVTQRGV